MAPLLFTFILMLVSLLNFLTVAEARTCRDLFKASSAPLTSVAGSVVPDQQLSPEGRDYITFLKYLVEKRRLVGPEILQKIIASAKPINPLGDSRASVQLLPYQSAFADLLGQLNDPAQWRLIQRAANEMSGAAAQTAVRAQSAAKATEGVVQPIPGKVFPFHFSQVVAGPDGRSIGIVDDYDLFSEKTTFKGIEISSGKVVSRAKVAAQVPSTDLSAQMIGRQLVVSGPEFHTRELVSVDLTPGNRDKIFPRHKINPDFTAPDWADGRGEMKADHAVSVDLSGRRVVATFLAGNVHFIDPVNDQEVFRIGISGDPEARVYVMGAFGNLVYANFSDQTSVIIDPVAKKKISVDGDDSVLRGFTHQGKRFAIAFEPSSRLKSGLQTYQYKVLPLDSDDPPIKFSVKYSEGQQEVVHIFVHNDRVYGVFNLDEDFALVDLLSGEVVRYASETFTDGKVARLRAFIGRENQVGFEFSGHPYLVGFRSRKGDTQNSELTIFDAVTLAPVAPGFKLDREVAGFFHLAPQGGSRGIVVSYQDLTSQVFQLATGPQP